MGKLVYTVTMSVDGFAADASGDFQWGAPDEEVFATHVERLQTVSTEVLGRRTYELMTYWNALQPEWSADEQLFARRWQSLRKYVVSSTLAPQDLADAQTQLQKNLSVAELQQLVDQADGDVEIFGPTTVAPALEAGLVEELHLFVVPVLIGSGLQALPTNHQRRMRLLGEHRFSNGTLHLIYGRITDS